MLYYLYDMLESAGLQIVDDVGDVLHLEAGMPEIVVFMFKQFLW